jgi:pSer/pThr/pTyr-binding forkhead associated (FHA) protein
MTAILVLVLRFALAIALYAFLGWILYTFWQELRQQGQILSAQKRPGLQIHARLENGKEIHHQFLQTEVTIGRDPNCDFPVIDEAISAHHARISYHHTQWWLEDLSSTNGTFMGNNQVSVPTVLITSDQFKCGNTVFSVQVDVVVE